MKRRYVYLLLFALPAAIAAALFSVTIFGIITGALWVFVLGDDPWPKWIGTGVGLLAALVFLVVFALILKVAFEAGKRQEAATKLSSVHVGYSLAATVALIALIIAHQYTVGNLGKPSNSILCADYCRAKGFNTSRMPPEDEGNRLCGCLDSNGSEVITVPLDTTLER